ncbi:MAG TPA: hypothetical protein VGL93_23230 [Streptosporangiaceae bacterium]
MDRHRRSRPRGARRPEDRDGRQDADHRLETDADDLGRLAGSLGGPATILGATVALHTLVRHPAIVRTLVPFEPPAVRLLPRDGVAMARAAERNAGDHLRANAVHWFEHELRQDPAAGLDLEALRAHADRIVPAAGHESRGYPCRDATAELARRLGRPVVDLPGGHVGCMSHPTDCSTEITRVLSAHYPTRNA